MLPVYPGWTRRVSGDAIVLEGDAGRIVYRDDLTPVVPLGRAGERFITDEGEYGAIVEEPGRTLAVVVGDWHHARLEGTGTPAVAAAVRALAAKVILGLGVRRRRVWHRPPPGWTGLPRGLSSDYLAPWPLRGATRLRVYPATPCRLAVEDVARALVEETGATVRDRAPLPHGLCLRTVVEGRDGWLHRDWALQRVGDFQYTVRLEAFAPTSLERGRAALAALVESIEWVPVPAPRVASQTGSHWAD